MSALEHSGAELNLNTLVVPHKTRLIRGLRSLIICWVLAAGAVFIPVLHFVLVPLFALGGLFFALNSYSDDVMLDTGNVIKCLKCNSQMSLKDSKDQFPKWIQCENCQLEHQIASR